MTAIAGGIASVLGGGKFANGAMSAAFVMMFNDMMTRTEVIKKYGSISNRRWKNESKWMTIYNIPKEILYNKNYHWINSLTNKLVTHIYINKDIAGMLNSALINLAVANELVNLRTFDGCFNIRLGRRSSSVSAHSYGIAIDINADENKLGTKGTNSGAFINSFKSAGFDYGGNWAKRPDPMHFGLGF